MSLCTVERTLRKDDKELSLERISYLFGSGTSKYSISYKHGEERFKLKTIPLDQLGYANYIFNMLAEDLNII